MRLEHGRNRLVVHEDDTFAAEVAACAGQVAMGILDDNGINAGAALLFR